MSGLTGLLKQLLVAPLAVAMGGTGASTAPANQVFAGPTSGPAASPSFRALVPADDPAPADGCCRLSVASTTSLILKPLGGNTLWVGGQACTIPSGGVPLSGQTSLATNTLYYVYATASGGAVNALSLSTTGHVTGSDGREYLSSGGSTPTAVTTSHLVGMVYTNASGQFQDVAAFRGCLNWFNRRALSVSQTANNQGTSSTSLTGITTGLSFLTWPDEAVALAVSGFGTSSSAITIISNVFVDGAAAGQQCNDTITAGGYGALSSRADGPLSEGPHTAQAAGAVSGGTGNFYVTLSGTIRG